MRVGIKPGVVARSCGAAVSADRTRPSGAPFFFSYTLLAIVVIPCSIGSNVRHQQRDNREPTFVSWNGDGMNRRSFLAASAASLAAPRIARAAQSVLRMVPQANLTSIDPIWTT